VERKGGAGGSGSNDPIIVCTYIKEIKKMQTYEADSMEGRAML
jgi:hypothetical protein